MHLTPAGSNVISHGFQPVVNKKQNVVLAEFLPFEAKIVTKRDAAKLELLVIQAKWCNVSQEQTRLDGLLFDLLN